MGWLDGQVALVTGGGSGIGRAVVARYIAEGARVAVMERVATRADDIRREFGEAAIGIAGDVASLADNKRAVAETVRAFGRLDIFVGNAGIFDVYEKITEIDEETLGRAFDELFAVNVKGCVFGVRAALPELRKTAGCIVLTASVAGLNSGGGGALYTASKHAVVGLIRQLAIELGPEIRVNGVAPGGTMTDLRGLATLGNDDRSQFADPGRRRPAARQQPAADRARTRRSRRRLCVSRVAQQRQRHHRQHRHGRCGLDPAPAARRRQ